MNHKILVWERRFTEGLQPFGAKLSIQQTGDPRWVRGFIHLSQKDGIPLSLGRVSFFNGDFYGLKWYGGQASINDKHGHLKYGLEYFIRFNVYLTVDRWNAAVTKAKELHQQDLARKIQWRKDNPIPANRKQKKRKPLEGRSAEAFLLDILGESSCQ
ncbi:MAG: hypothetical protein OEX12_16255 [Gammaproteobacteria bacterium]|nr:hypothetical protein [Gammaproteobacteria bacterium]